MARKDLRYDLNPLKFIKTRLWGLSLIFIYFSYPFQMRFDIPAKEVMLTVVDL